MMEVDARGEKNRGWLVIAAEVVEKAREDADVCLANTLVPVLMHACIHHIVVG